MFEDYTHKLHLAKINVMNINILEAWLLIDLEERLQRLGKEFRVVCNFALPGRKYAG